MNELEQLLTAARAGDLDAFGRVVRRFQDMAYGYAYSILGDFHLAEDAAQDAFVEAFRSLDKLNELAAFPGWLRRIVQFRCSRVARSRGASPAPLEAAAGVAAESVDPSEMAERTELSAKVLAAIAALPEQQRAVTTLFYINGYTTNDIAEFLEVPAGTVKSRLAGARKRLRQRMLTMVEQTLHNNAPDERFSEDVINELIGGPNLIEVAGHPMRRACKAIIAALTEFEVIENREFVDADALPKTMQADIRKGVADEWYRSPTRGLLGRNTVTSTLAAAQGRAAPARLVNPGRGFDPKGWPGAPEIKAGHVLDTICIAPDVGALYVQDYVNRAIRAVHPDVEVRVDWGEDNDSGGPGKTIVRRSVDFLIHKGDMWHSVARGGLLRSTVLHECGFDPQCVSGSHIGIGLERLVLPALGLDLDDVRKLWQPPYVPR